MRVIKLLKNLFFKDSVCFKHNKVYQFILTIIKSYKAKVNNNKNVLKCVLILLFFTSITVFNKTVVKSISCIV